MDIEDNDKVIAYRNGRIWIDGCYFSELDNEERELCRNSNWYLLDAVEEADVLVIVND